MNSDICMGCFEPMNGFEVCSHCGWYSEAVPEHAYHLHQGTVLRGRYIVGNTVGVGGFGITYKAWDSSLNSMVAIKEFYPAGLVSRVPGEKELVIFSGDKKEQFDTSLVRFLTEARTMAKFTNHPDIVHVFDFFEENNTAYIVMEFLDGITLKQYVETLPEGKMDVEAAKDVVLHILDALSEMHSQKIIHRDISPDNIQLTTGNQIKIFDFGAARLTKEDTEETRSIVVKTGYTPPEQYRAKSKQGPYTDLYSVGAVLYKLITGVTPDESIDRLADDTLKKPSKHGIDIDADTERVIMKALALKHELRFRSAEQFKNALLNKKSVDFPEVELKKRRRMRVIAASLLSLFTIAFFTFFGIYITSEGEDPLVCDDGKITVMLPVSGDEATAGAQAKMYQAIVDKFIETAKEPTESMPEGNTFEVELITVPQTQYHDTLMQQISAGDAPDVFNTDGFGSDLSEYAGNLELLAKGTSSEECIILESYKKAYPNKCEMPTGFYSGVIYANLAAARTAGIDIAAASDDVSEILKSAANNNGVYSAIIAEDNVDDTLNALIKDDLYNSREGKINPEASGAFALIGESAVNQGLNYAEANSTLFLNNGAVYCVDDSTELHTVRQMLPGYYTILPLTSEGKLVITMTKHLGIDKTSDENTKKIAMQFIRFLLTDYSQDMMHIQNNIALPVNESSLNNFLMYNGDVAFIGDYYGNFKINGEGRHISYDFNQKLYEEIMRQNGDYSQISKYMELK